VPAFGETEFTLVAPPAVAGGWLHVETRDALTLADLPTTGFVACGFCVERSGPSKEAAPACVFAPTLSVLPVLPSTEAVQLINQTRDSTTPTTLVPLAVTVDVVEADGTIFSSTPLVLGPSESTTVVLPVGFFGSVVATPTLDDPTKLEAFTLAAKESRSSLSLAYETHYWDFLSFRLAEAALQHGPAPEGEFRDFQLVVVNPTDGVATFTIDRIVTDTGVSVLPFPRLVAIPAGESRVYATTTVDSLGLDSGEVSPLDDIFGDPFLATTYRRFVMGLTIGEGLYLSSRDFDPSIAEFEANVRGLLRTHDAMVIGIEQETTVVSGRRNWISLMNPATGPITVLPRAYTPGGTEHILPSILVPAWGRLDWSPDAITLNGLLGLREDQNDPTSLPVPFFSLRFISAGSFGVEGRREVRNASDLLLFVTPFVVEPLDD
jgi:hypothetical protein